MRQAADSRPAVPRDVQRDLEELADAMVSLDAAVAELPLPTVE